LTGVDGIVGACVDGGGCAGEKARHSQAQAAASRPKVQARTAGATFSIDAITHHPGENSEMIITEMIVAGDG
jgi:hypothetical protein